MLGTGIMETTSSGGRLGHILTGECSWGTSLVDPATARRLS